MSFIRIAVLWTLFVIGENVSSNFNHSQVVKVGEFLELQCSLPNVRSFQVLWIKVDTADPSNTTLLSSGYKLMIKNNRFSLKYDQVWTTPSLQINKVQEADDGHYQCQVLLSDKQNISLDTRVLVAIPPIIFENSTKSVVAKEGQFVQLECYAGGYPAPVVSWIHDDHAILPTESSQYNKNVFIIPSVTRKDCGIYICLAENGIGRSKRRSVLVEVEFAPIVSVWREKISQALLHDMDLVCGGNAYPAPQITWWKDGVQLMNNQHYNISNFISRNSFFETKLHIMKAEKQHFGLYECRASNEFGTGKAFVEFIEAKNPVCPPACDPTSTSAASTKHLPHYSFLFGFSLAFYMFFN